MESSYEVCNRNVGDGPNRENLPMILHLLASPVGTTLTLYGEFPALSPPYLTVTLWGPTSLGT